MDECFLLSSTKDVQPVGAIDAHVFKLGPATVGQRLKQAFDAYYRSSTTAHPELRVF